MSRQREWQKEKRAQGKCPICGKKQKKGYVYCIRHYELRKIATRNLYRKKHNIPLDKPIVKWGLNKENYCRNLYRIKNGIPLDAPLWTRASKNNS